MAWDVGSVAVGAIVGFVVAMFLFTETGKEITHVRPYRKRYNHD